jgi:hypothetical protein
MKKLSTLLLLVAVMASTMNCTKKDAPNEPKAEVSAIRENTVARSGDFQSRGQMYSLLTDNEKFQLWQAHLQKAKLQFTAAGMSAKVALVDELLAGISPAVFTDNSIEGDVFSNYNIPMWDARAKTILTDQEIYVLTFDPNGDVMGGLTAPGDIGNLPGDDGMASCFCNVGTSGFSCRKIIIGTSPSIQNGICERTSADCHEIQRDCGWFWHYACDGNHCQF